MTPLILTLALLGQSCSGSSCSPTMMVPMRNWPTYYVPMPTPQQILPTPQAIATEPARPAKSEWAWHRVRGADGVPKWVWGWREGSDIRWVTAEQPPSPPEAMLAALVRPSPREAETPAKREPTPEPLALTVPNPGSPPNVGSSNLGTPPTSDPAPNVVGALPAFATSGVDRSKLALRAGYQTRHDAAQRFVEAEVKATQIPEDKDKPRLTVIGSEGDVAPVIALTKGNGPLAKLAAEMHVQSYAPDSPYVAGLGFRTGKPAVYIQNKAGRVLHRQDDFTGGEPALVLAIERSGALRKADPTYDPAKDTDHRETPLSISSFDLGKHWAWLVLGLAVLFTVARGKQPVT